MTQIRIDTEYVREIGRHLVNQGDRVSEIGQELQRAISSLDTGAWDGRSRARAEPMLDRVRPESSRVANRLEELGRKLRHVADTFEQEDNTAARNLEGMPWVDFETSGGRVLGASTVATAMSAPAAMYASLNMPLENYRPRDISKMSWADRFDYADELREQIKELGDAQQKLKDKIDKCDQEIADIDEQIARLRAQRDALQEKADDWQNKLKPDDDGLRWGFDDGIIDAPWRTESDDMEDQIADLDERIEGLQEERQGLIEQRAGYQQELEEVNQNLRGLRESQAELEQVMREEGCSLQACSPTIGGEVKQSQGVHLAGEGREGYRGVSIDIAPKDKSQIPSVHSIQDGTVKGVGYEEGYGNYIKVLQDDGKVVLYGHLAEASTFEEGDTVRTGEQLGTMGDTGDSTGTHLHLEFRQPNSADPDKYVTDNTGLVTAYKNGEFNPKDYLEDNGVSI
jgi:WXG100 family type VII secretion target